MRPLQDHDQVQLQLVLDALLAEDVDITVRQVARRHPTLKHASAFTRNSARMALIAKAQQRQWDARQISSKPLREKSARLSELLSKRSAEAELLRKQVTHLVAGHVALIRAVQLAGGSAALERFWDDYKNVAQELQRIGAVPEWQNVVDFETSALRSRQSQPMNGESAT